MACEFSARVREAFRKAGHDAWSCDLLPSEDAAAFHITGDALLVADREPWDLMIAHPPCTRLANSGVRWLHKPPAGRTKDELWQELNEAAKFYRLLRDAPIKRKAIENPVMHCYARALIQPGPRQIVQPWWFGEPQFKATGFELINLPPLIATNRLAPPKSGTDEHQAMVQGSPHGKDTGPVEEPQSHAARYCGRNGGTVGGFGMSEEALRRAPTPEMIAAGVREWLDGSPGLSSPEAMVCRVFTAMCAAADQSPVQSLRGALEGIIAHWDEFGTEAGLGEAIDLARAALSEGQAPEPVAQEPVAWRHFDGFMWNHTGIPDFADEWRARGLTAEPLYTHPAGMDAARAKAIEECAQVCEALWKDASNARPQYRQTAVSHGCLACATAIRALATKGTGS